MVYEGYEMRHHNISINIESGLSYAFANKGVNLPSNE
jgi:hypothetical protein